MSRLAPPARAYLKMLCVHHMRRYRVPSRNPMTAASDISNQSTTITEVGIAVPLAEIEVEMD